MNNLNILASLWLSKVLIPFSLFALLVFSNIQYSLAVETCENLLPSPALSSQETSGARFLLERNQHLHLSPLVQRAARMSQQRTDSRTDRPQERVSIFLHYLKSISQKAQNGPYNLNTVREILYNEYVVLKDSNAPKSYFNLRFQQARELGYGSRPFSENEKQRITQILIADQKGFLDSWIEYLVSPDTNMYPVWMKYWMFTSMTKLSQLNLETGTFGSRSRDTVAPFPELNREALAYVVDAVLNKINKNNLSEIEDERLLQLLQGMSFGNLYSHALIKTGNGPGQFLINEGRWVVYKRGSDYMSLVKALEGKNTGWCIAGKASAKDHLNDGDFHVYYSLDKNGEPTLPRLVIFVERSSIVEVRGVAPNQNFDPQISASHVLTNKLREFGNEGKLYQKRTAQMGHLTEIERKVQLGQTLTKEDLVFLYEINDGIEGFGHLRDPRINQLKAGRDIRNDLSIAFDGRYSPDEISLTREEALSGRAKLHYGDLDLSDLTIGGGLTLPEYVMGGLNLKNLTSAHGLVLPQYVEESLYLKNLKSVQGLIPPQHLGGVMILSEKLRNDPYLESIALAKDKIRFL